MERGRCRRRRKRKEKEWSMLALDVCGSGRRRSGWGVWMEE